MKDQSNSHTKIKVKLGDIAQIVSGVYAKESPTGEIAYLQVKDLTMPSPETSVSHIEYTAKLNNYLLKKGDLLFAGKGSTYLCEIFDLNIKAVPSTTLYYIRPDTNIVSVEYLRWYLNHPSIVATIKTAQVGSGTPLIHKPTLEQLMIIVPDLETQRKIVEIAGLQKREKEIMESIAAKKMQITSQILFNELKKQQI